MVKEHYDDFSQPENCVVPAVISMKPDGCLIFESAPDSTVLCCASDTLHIEPRDTNEIRDRFVPPTTTCANQ